MNRFNIVHLFMFYTCFAAKDPVIVNIPDQGAIGGVELANMRIHKILGFYGIPYAQPPLGNLRFSPPVIDPLPQWDGVKNTTDYPNSCLQTSEGYKKEDLPFFDLFKNFRFNTSEDCLYLNVFTPMGNKPPNGFAVIVWIHPGNFSTGSPAMWNPHTLVHRQKVILVTFSYRLNIMGFFTTMDGEAAGNYGLMDQQAALRWVNRNIALFGGDPNNIVLMGSGGGGISVGIHMINPDSRPLFHKAIIMSANLMDQRAFRLPAEDKTILDKLSNDFGCIRHPTSQMIDCLRRIDGDILVDITSYVNWRPLIDKDLSNSTLPFLPELPKSYFESGDIASIPLLTGYTQMEKILAIESLSSGNSEKNVSKERIDELLRDIILEDLPKKQDEEEEDEEEQGCAFDNHEHILNAIHFFYTPYGPISSEDEFRKIIIDFTTEKDYAAPTLLQASYIAEKGQPVYVYRFDIKPSSPQISANVPEWVTVPHLFDLIYVWGIPYWRHDAEYDGRDKRISDAIMSFWTNFAKFSAPTKNAIYPINWEQFTKKSPGMLLIDNTFTMSSDKDVNYKAFEFWNDYFPKVMAIGSQCCSATGNSNVIITGNVILIVPFCYFFFK